MASEWWIMSVWVGSCGALVIVMMPLYLKFKAK